MNISELKELWSREHFRPKKSLGQNFLIDKNIRDKIVSHMDIPSDSIVLEVGAGFGMMSFLIARKCKKLFLVEKDKALSVIMKPYFGKHSNIELITNDILEVEIENIIKDGKMIFFGNIPYYITTPIIEKIIDNRKHIRVAYIVMQNEFADRIVSSPGTKDYGSISCYIQFYSSCKKVFNIKAGKTSGKKSEVESIISGYLYFLNFIIANKVLLIYVYITFSKTRSRLVIT